MAIKYKNTFHFSYLYFIATFCFAFCSALNVPPSYTIFDAKSAIS